MCSAANQHGLRRVEGSFLNTLAVIASQFGDFAAHLELGQQQWLLFKDMGDLPAEGGAQLHLGISLLGAGEQLKAAIILKKACVWRVRPATGRWNPMPRSIWR